MRSFVLISVFVQLIFSDFVCDVKLNVGKSCKSGNDNSTIKYYFDSKLLFCYPYKFLGCEEGQNSFNSEDECLSTCKPVDQIVCGGNSKPVGTCNGFKDKKCASGTICVNGAMIGLCCDQKIQEEWNSEQTPKCSDNSQKVVDVKTWFGSAPLIGRECAHDFCPTGSKCVQRKWTAHCCTQK